MSETPRIYRPLVGAILTGAIVLFAGCASAPVVPSASLAEARRAIEVAEREDASHYAAAELDEARQKLLSADKAVAAEKMIAADQLAQEAAATAELASAKTEATKAVAVNLEISRSTQALTEELQRAGDKR
jgi:hypothetical protein